MNYQETLDYLFSILPMYQRVGKAAYKQDLSNTIELLERLNNPHDKFRSVHIAGTNGKGSSAHSIAAILQHAGYKVGLYTSPHLKNFTERIKINGQEISENFIVDFVKEIKPSIELIKPSFFEVTVALAFHYFASEKVDIAIIETGLGGRLDSTNVISPEVSLITNIGMDHTDLLGDTLQKIALEKAGIIKEQTPVIIGSFQEEVIGVFQDIADKRNTTLTVTEKDYSYPDLSNLFPNYFKRNIPGVLGVVEALRKKGFVIHDLDVTSGLNNVVELTGLKGRFQKLGSSPLTIADVSHNKEGLELLLEEVKQLRKTQLHLIFGSVLGRDLEPIFQLFPNDAKYYWVQSSAPRSLSSKDLRVMAKQKGFTGETFQDVNEAIKQANQQARAEDMILITGSTFIVAEIHDL